MTAHDNCIVGEFQSGSMNNPLFHPANEPSRTTSVRDDIQIALAIADSTLLKALLVNCIPPVAPASHIGAVSSEVGVPIKDHPAADGILQYESIRCTLSDSRPQGNTSSNSNGWNRANKEFARLTQHESEMQILGQNLPLALAIALLTNAGFRPEQVNEVLRLPHYAWHKSWWYGADANGDFTLPFLRCIRSFRYPDGTLTLQYKDFFEQEKPECFASVPQKVLVLIRPEAQGFAETLQHINRQRDALRIQQAVLICDRVSELEAQAFTRQGISLYALKELTLPVEANCERCGRRECPMNRLIDSPVVLCRGFILESEFV